MKSEERVLFIVGDTVIHGNTRFQKYGFLLFKQFDKELKKLKNNCDMDQNYYDDWKPHYYGPFSKQLETDIDKCVNDEILIKTHDEERNCDRYELTLKSRQKWRKIFEKCPNELITINDKIRYLQTMSLHNLLEQIYDAYPKYIVNSLIKDSI